MHLDPAALGIGRSFQCIQTGLGERILRVGLVVRPREHNLARSRESAYVVNVLVGLVVVNTARQPDHLGNAQIIAQNLLNLSLCEIGIASRAQQAGFGDKRGALAVRVDGAALANEIAFVVYVVADQVAELARHAVVLLPRGIQAVHIAAPRVETPVDAAALSPAVDNKGRANVTRPRIVSLHHDQTNAVGQLRTRVVILPFRAEHGHAFAFGNRLDHTQKGFPGRIGAVLPAVGAFRPDHQAALMRCKLRRHIKPVLRRCSVQNFHGISPVRWYIKSTTF